MLGTEFAKSVVNLSRNQLEVSLSKAGKVFVVSHGINPSYILRRGNACSSNTINLASNSVPSTPVALPKGEPVLFENGRIFL